MTKKGKILLGALAIVVVIAGSGIFAMKAELFKGQLFSKNITKSTVQKTNISPKTTTDLKTVVNPKIANTVCFDGLMFKSKSSEGKYKSFSEFKDAVTNNTLNKNCKYYFNIEKNGIRKTMICSNSTQELKTGIFNMEPAIICQPNGGNSGIYVMENEAYISEYDKNATSRTDFTSEDYEIYSSKN